MREACLLPGSTPLCPEAKDRDGKRGKLPDAEQIADKLCWPEMSRFGGWNSGQLLQASCDLPEDGLTQRGERDERGRALWLRGRESRSVRPIENPGRVNILRRSLDHCIGDLLERREDVSRVGAGANHSEEHRVGIAVLAEPGNCAPGTEELGDFVSVFQLQHERIMETDTSSRLLTSWYAGREDAVNPSGSCYGGEAQADLGG